MTEEEEEEEEEERRLQLWRNCRKLPGNKGLNLLAQIRVRLERRLKVVSF